jgi:H+/Cl- antiporter ClcA
MIFIFVFVAFILTWFFIEITLFIANQNNNYTNNSNIISYKRFVWILRFLTITLLAFIIIYMYNFENIKFQQAIEYCLGLIK